MAAPILVANVDTSRLSPLAEHSSDPECVPLVDALVRGDVHLVICHSRVFELSSLAPSRRSTLLSFLRDVPTLIGQPESVLEEDELTRACVAVAGETRRPPQPFARGTVDWGYAINAIGGTAADLLAAFDSDSQEADSLRELAKQHVTTAREFCERAAVVSDRAAHLRAQLERHLAERRLTAPTYGGGLDAQTIIDRKEA
jgi:hypothetical protein